MTADEAAPPAIAVRRWRYGSAVQVARALNAVARVPHDMRATRANEEEKNDEGPELALGAFVVGTPYGIRTRASGVRGQRPGPLDERGM